jgi:glycosyltransferase involved in cell wall biosynthesis
VKVAHLSFSKAGGAGSVAINLSEALRAIGVDSVVENSIESDLRKTPLALPLHTIAAGSDEYLVKSQNFPNTVSFLREGLSQKLTPSAKGSDVVNLHWTPGQVSTETVGKLLDSGKAIVWTLHDMWPFTAGCHYAGACDGFKSGCTSCPAVKPLFQNLVNRNYGIKKAIFDQPRGNLVFVAPSQWIAKMARSSTLLKNQRVEVVPNPVARTHVEKTQATSSAEWREKLGVAQDSFLVAFSAANLADNRKNLLEVIESLSELSQIRQDLNLVLVLFGSGAVPESKGLTIKRLGFLRREELNTALANCDALINFSKDENLSMASIEALAVGTPLVLLNSGGNPELIKDGETGFLVGDRQQLNNRIEQLAVNPVLAKQMGQAAQVDFTSRFEASVVANQYLDLYSSLLAK